MTNYYFAVNLLLFGICVHLFPYIKRWAGFILSQAQAPARVGESLV